MRAPGGRGKSKPSRKRPSGTTSISARLREAEATLEAIRTGRVDALVVSGAEGDQTRTIEGATHPYFVLLNAMSDGAALLESDGTILFANVSLANIAGMPFGTLRGSTFQRFIAKAERASFETLLREGSSGNVQEEFTVRGGTASAKPVAITISTLPLGPNAGVGAPGSRENVVLMAIVRDLTYMKAVEETRARLLGRLISAEDDERRRIARELHDETGQSLTAVLVGLRAIADMDIPIEVRPVALRLREVAAQTMDDIARLARGLHPAVLDDAGLEAAASRYVNDYAQSLQAEVEFVAGDLDSPPLPPIVAATAYRILQEALTNVARHARAKQVDVELKRQNGTVEVIVRDDGVGFDVAETLDAVTRLGLRGMRERVTLLGGSIDVESSAGKGTLVRAQIPAVASAPPARRRNS